MSKLFEQINTAYRTSKRLGEVVGYIADNRGKNPSYYVDNGIPVIDNFMITGEKKVDLSISKRFIDEKIYKEFIRKEIKKDDVLVTLVGNGFGQIALAPEEKSVIIQNTVGLRSNDLSLNLYLFYLLTKYKDVITGLDRGAAQPSLKVGDLLDVEFDLPDLSIQKKIALILGAYDEKIENNNKIIKNLEETAQTIFNEWFVNFKFPGYEKVKMVDSEMGEIPEGWEEGKLSKLLKVKHGFAFPGNGFKDFGMYPVIKIKNITESNVINLDNPEFVETDEYGEKIVNYELHDEDMLIAMTGATSGKIAILMNSYKKYFLNQRVGKFEFIKPENKWFVFIFLIKKENRNLLLNMSNGSAQGNLSPSQIEDLEILIPDIKILKSFNILVNKLFKKKFELQKENISLKSQRDLLLAKLI